MWVVVAFILLGLGLGLRIQSRLGALFLCLAGVCVVHVLLDSGPRLLNDSAYGRRLAAGLHLLSQHGGGSLTDTALATAAGVLAAILLQTMSEDRRQARWDPDKAIRRRLKREGPVGR